MSKGHDFVLIDAFSSIPLIGNPVAIFFDADDLSDKIMQQIAMEMHLSEVTFIRKPLRGGTINVKIFTPVNELPFAGHPLIGTAHAYLDRIELDEALFETQVGTIKVWREQDADGHSLISMFQPFPRQVAFNNQDQVLAALKLTSNPTPICLYVNGPRHLIVHITTVSDLFSIKPNYDALSTFPDMAINCFSIENDIVYSRMFSPAYGVIEDAGTGSAAGPLAIHCINYNLMQNNNQIIIEQGHLLGKRCVMKVKVQHSSLNSKNVILSGETSMVGAGHLVI